MESKNPRSAPRWTVILEEIRSQNRATLEAVESSRAAHEERMDRSDERTDARLTVVETVVRSLGKEVAVLGTRMGGVETHMIAIEAHMGAIENRMDGVEAHMGGIDARMSSWEQKLEQSDQENRGRLAALEAALQRMDQESRSRDASLELAIRDLKVNVQQNSVDLRDLAIKVGALSHLEARISALER
jgi:septal ring factor EnvC (AmiA/AmiB activator)